MIFERTIICSLHDQYSIYFRTVVYVHIYICIHILYIDMYTYIYICIHVVQGRRPKGLAQMTALQIRKLRDAYENPNRSKRSRVTEPFKENLKVRWEEHPRGLIEAEPQ